MSWSARKAANTSISAPEPRWVHSFTGGVSHTRRAEAPKPIAKNQAHEALITLAANPSRSPALWTAIAPPRRPTVSKTAWGFSKETPPRLYDHRADPRPALHLRLFLRGRAERRYANHHEEEDSDGDQEPLVARSDEERRSSRRPHGTISRVSHRLAVAMLTRTLDNRPSNPDSLPQSFAPRSGKRSPARRASRRVRGSRREPQFFLASGPRSIPK